MFYKIFISIHLFFVSIVAYNQYYNLVSNGNFETYTVCPPSSLRIANAIGWYSPINSTNTVYFCDYLNACSTSSCCGVPSNIFGLNYQYAHSGVGYIVGYMMYAYGSDIRDYAQTQLKQTLSNSKYYYVEFFVSLVNRANYGINNIGLLLTDTATRQPTNGKFIAANPQIINYGNPKITDTLNWVKISGIYKAQGGEQYITIGNFKIDNQTDTIGLPAGLKNGEYSIDDVSVIPLDSFSLKADAGKDTTIHIGDSAFIGTLTNGIDSIKWQVLNSNNTIDSIRPGFWVHPTVNTCYVVTQTVNGYTSSDTVCVIVSTVPLKFLKYEVQSTSEKQVENKWSTANEVNVSHFYIQSSTNGKDFNIIGEQKAENKSYNEYEFTDNSPLLTVDSRPSTLYYRIASVDIDGKINFSEVRELIINHTSLNTIAIYPNPAKDVVNIECKDAKEVSIIDCLGRVVHQQILRQAQNGAVTVNCKQLNSGLYVVQVITSKGNVRNEKLVVQ